MLDKGTKIYYSGDMANMEGFGTITRAYVDRWGSWYDIGLDDGRKFPGLHSLAMNTVDKGNGSTRFVTLEAYQTRRAEQIEAFRQRIEEMKRVKKEVIS